MLYFTHLYISKCMSIEILHYATSCSETQEDLEAITNDIKKLANSARNKLKSESASHYYIEPAILNNFDLYWIWKQLNSGFVCNELKVN